MNDFLIFAFLFFIGSCLGWCIELLFRKFFSGSNPERKWINPGFLTGPYLPLYGFGLWGMYEISHVIKLVMTENKILDTLIIFLIMAIIMTIIEYIAGLIFIKGMKVKLWDYSAQKFNLQGIICPLFTIIWGLLGSLYYFTVNSHVEGWVAWLANHLTFSFFIGMFFGIFAVDLWYSLEMSAKMRKFAVDNQLVIRYEELKAFLREQREQREERSRFLLAFKTEEPFREHLEKYLEHSIENQRKKFEEAKEELKKAKEDVRNKVTRNDERDNKR